MTSIFDRVTILLVVYSAFSFGMAQHVFRSVSPWRVVEMVAVCAVLLAAMLGVTYGIARLARLSRADTTVVVFCGSKKSLGSGLPMALLLFGVDKVGLIMLPLMLYHQIQLVVCAWIAGRMRTTSRPTAHRPRRNPSCGWCRSGARRAATAAGADGATPSTTGHLSVTRTSVGKANTIQSSRSISPSSCPIVHPE